MNKYNSDRQSGNFEELNMLDPAESKQYSSYSTGNKKLSFRMITERGSMISYVLQLLKKFKLQYDSKPMLKQDFLSAEGGHLVIRPQSKIV